MSEQTDQPKKVFAYAASDMGQVRKRNEDACGHAKTEDGAYLFCVADGMGGFRAGDVASHLAVKTITEAWVKAEGEITERLKSCILEANKAVIAAADEMGLFEKMGTTIVTISVKDDQVYLGWAGDSRAYRLREGELAQLTTDHTEAQSLVKDGVIEAEQAEDHAKSHVLTRCLGLDPQLEPSVEGPLPALDADTFLLCTDGLTGVVDDGIIGQALRYLSIGDATKGLVKLANHYGGPDNVTVTVVRYGTHPNALEPLPKGLKLGIEKPAPVGLIVAALLLLVAALAVLVVL